MPRQMVYDVDVEIPAAAMYRNITAIDYWQDLVDFYRDDAVRAEIAHFSSDSSGTDIAFAHTLSPDSLPAVARGVLPETLAVTREQHFEPFTEATNEARGRYRARIPAPAEVSGDYLLRDVEQGSRMTLTTVCHVWVPIIGGQIELLLANGLKTLFAKEGEFTADWVRHHR